MGPRGTWKANLLCWLVLMPQIGGEALFPGDVTVIKSTTQSPRDPPNKPRYIIKIGKSSIGEIGVLQLYQQLEGLPVETVRRSIKVKQEIS